MNVAFDITKLFVREVLENAHVDPNGRDWSIQGFGMLRCYLSPDVRLHIWDPQWRIEKVSDIHDHPWHFTSLVISGSIENRRYSIQNGNRVIGDARDGATHQQGVIPVRGFIEYNQGRIVCGPSPTEKGAKDVKRVALYQWCEGVFTPGTTYAQHADELHSSHPESGTITIIKRTKSTKDPERALVYWPLDTEWVSAEPRRAEYREVQTIVGRALDLMGKP